MPEHWSKELNLVLRESQDVATRLGETQSTAHLLLCLFTSPNGATTFLKSQEITAEALLKAMKSADQRPSEANDHFDKVLRRAEDVANFSKSPVVSSLHVVYALCSVVESAAYELLVLLEVDVPTLRARALAHLQNLTDEERNLEGELPYHKRDAPQEARVFTETVTEERVATPQAPVTRGRATPRRPPRSSPTQDLKARLHAARAAKAAVAPAPRARRSTGSQALPPTVRRADSSPRRSRSTAAKVSKPSRRLRRKQLLLDEREYPTLSRFGRNLTLLAFDDAIDAVVGRDDEIEQLVDILNKRRSNNPLLLGDPGVGKTAIAEGLAMLIAKGEKRQVGVRLEGKIIVELEASRIVSGTGLRGSFSERLQRIKDEVRKSDGRVILFLDELHRWIGMGSSGDGNGDGAGELKTALARGELPCIGATTYEEYRKYIEKDDAFARRFQQVPVKEPSQTEAVTILEGIRSLYETHHGVTFGDGVMEAAVHLSHRYIPDRQLPDKAINVLDMAGSRAQRLGTDQVSTSLVATVVGEIAKIAPEKLLMADADRFLNLEEQLMQRIVGHQAAIERVAHVLRRNYAGFAAGRPIGSFLFLGPTGVGKTEFAKAMTQVVFQDEGSMLRFDMSEFMESHAVARLIGAPPGYVGHDAGGELTDAVRRRPYALVLFDELEKAHPDILNLLIQLLDEGRLTDARGRTVDFTNTIVVMTTNLGAQATLSASTPRQVGFGPASAAPASAPVADRALDAAKKQLRPELWNRIDEPLVFEALTRDEVARIARLQLTRSSERLNATRQIAFTCTPDVINHLIDSGGYDRELGARPMRRTIEQHVEVPIADMILRGEIVAPARLEVSVAEGTITVQVTGA